MRNRLLSVLLVLPIVVGCGKSDSPSNGSAAQPAKVKLALNWKPEPEFGGFYAAQINGNYSKHNLAVDIIGGGDQVPQMVAAGQVEFGIIAADELITARAKGIDLVGLFAVYQTNPQGIMAHAARNFSSIADVFAGEGTLAVQPGLAYVKFLEAKYPGHKVKIVPYDYSIVQFMADPKHSQQCFVTSEPIAAKGKGGDPKVFLIAESGFDPYAALVVTRGDYLKKNPAAASSFVASVREGWRAYLDEPKATNEAMNKLNAEMDLPTFAAAAEAQKALIETEGTKKSGLGSMSNERWETLGKQLVDLKVIDKAPPARECFVNP
jgi:NitT/TauT family transport system substrate-binding protein